MQPNNIADFAFFKSKRDFCEGLAGPQDSNNVDYWNDICIKQKGQVNRSKSFKLNETFKERTQS